MPEETAVGGSQRKAAGSPEQPVAAPGEVDPLRISTLLQAAKLYPAWLEVRIEKTFPAPSLVAVM
jgi:hypothetical protein